MILFCHQVVQAKLSTEAKPTLEERNTKCNELITESLRELKMAMLTWLGGLLGGKLKPMLDESKVSIKDLKSSYKAEEPAITVVFGRLNSLASWQSKFRLLLSALIKLSK